MKNSINQEIKRIRMMRMLSQENVAFELGITTGAYNKIENGQTNVSIGRLEQISEVLNVTLEVSFREKAKATPVVEDTKNMYGFATKGDMEEMMRMIQTLVKEIENLKSSQAVAPAKTIKSRVKKTNKG